MAPSTVMSYEIFWRRYLRAHARRQTRWLHYAGSLLALLGLLLAVVLQDRRWLVAAPLAGYGFAWCAHVCIEGNKPQTFGHPLWSLVSDYRMLFLWLTGSLGPHIAAAAASDDCRGPVVGR